MEDLVGKISYRTFLFRFFLLIIIFYLSIYLFTIIIIFFIDDI